MTDEAPPQPKARRGFAAMSPEKRREIARKGGAALTPEQRSFSRDPDLAISAGRKGGQTSHGGGRPRNVLRPPFMRADMPAAMRRLALDQRGYPIPWFVDRQAPLVDGNPDFRIMDAQRRKAAVKERRCWICGGRITDRKQQTFVAGPMCGVNRTSSEPPCHAACAEWAVRACPFLAVPKRVRNEQDLPGAAAVPGIGIKRNPGVVMLWTAATYKTWRPEGGGFLFEMGEPSAVRWFSEGRKATRAEVLDSVGTGLPLLLAEAAKEGAEACFALGVQAGDFMRLVPAEEPL